MQIQKRSNFCYYIYIWLSELSKSCQLPPTFLERHEKVKWAVKLKVWEIFVIPLPFMDLDFHGFWETVLGFFVVKIFWMNQPPQTFTNDATCTCLKLHLISKNCGLRSFSLSFFLFFSRSFEKVNLYNFVLLKKNKTKRTTNLHFRRSRCHLLIWTVLCQY